MLSNSHVATRLPAQDLARARAFYAEKLGLEPIEERPGGLLYECGGTQFALFASAGASAGDHTQMGWQVEDIEATVAWLRDRGVVFEEVDLPGLRTVDGIADIEGNYPSLGVGERGAWFRDSEGNMLGVGQPVRHKD
jgi:catechol 2,3-dioxygenase-like lactoylglutathione lyase family enzyme